MRCLAIERRVRATTIVPTCIKRQLPEERVHEKWHENDPRTFVLQTQDESFYQRDTPALANGAEPGCDPLAITPVLERVEPKLLAFIADNVFWCSSGGVNGTFEEMRNRYGVGLFLKV